MPKTLATSIIAKERSLKPAVGGPRLPFRRNLVLTEVPFVEGNCSFLNLADTTRLALLVTARGQGTFREQALEVLRVIQQILTQSSAPAAITVQTVFLRDSANQALCEQLFKDCFGSQCPVTNYVIQPPCCGAALAVEAWAIAGASARLERHGSQALVVEYDGMRWIYCGNVKVAAAPAYDQAIDCFSQLSLLLKSAGSSFESVIRTWLYVGRITDAESSASRYQELNRARTDFYREIQFGRSVPMRNGANDFYPASTGIGMSGEGMAMGCMALETKRQDVFLSPLENPQQVSAYAYDASYSLQSPKFSRGTALVADDYVTTWISGTASIVNAETRHVGNVEAQTEQTIDNIERLIAPENFARHNIRGAGATLEDLAKIRVYLKQPGDLAKCRAICERRFNNVPALYLIADICRPELLIEIEGVAFSKRAESTVAFHSRKEPCL